MIGRTMLLLALVAGSPAMAQAGPVMGAPVAGTLLDIDAQAEVTRVPDVATVTAGVVSQAPGAAAAMAETARRIAAATAALRKAGIAERDIRTAALSLQPQYRYADNQPPAITGYQASNQLTIRFHDVRQAGPILDALVAEGVNQIGGPDFGVEHPEAALDEARAKALETARERAALYARAAGLRVVRIVAISEASGAAPRGPRPMMMASMAKTQTELSPGDEAIGVSVHVTFELQ